MTNAGLTTTPRGADTASWPRWVAALGILWLTLVFPVRQEAFLVSSFLRMPIELPVLILALVLAPRRIRTVVLAVAATLLTVLLIVKLADAVLWFVFDRPLSFVADWIMAPIAFDTLARSSGVWAVAGAVIGVVALILVIAASLWWAMRTLQRQAPGGPVMIEAAAALIIAVVTPAGTAISSLLVRDHVLALRDDWRAAQAFRGELAAANVPPGQTLAALKGTDVLLIFVESYGRAAIDYPDHAPIVRARLQHFDKSLADAGFAARSAWVTSPTYGGASYLAHGTFISGLWVNDRQRYAQLLNSDRRTLIRDFGGAGWHTVAVMPLISGPWPEGERFGYDTIYDTTRLGYAGQSFGYVTMPDQYALSVLQTRELAPKDRKPVMAEVVLVSSHEPWTPLPKFVPWDQVGDGQIFNTARTGKSPDVVWRDLKRIHQYYAMSIDYSLQTLESFIVTYGRDNTLFIILGDHQPMGLLTQGPAHEVPIHIIARDPARLAALGADWTPGMLPDTAKSDPTHECHARTHLAGFHAGRGQDEGIGCVFVPYSHLTQETVPRAGAVAVIHWAPWRRTARIFR